MMVATSSQNILFGWQFAKLVGVDAVLAFKYI